MAINLSNISQYFQYPSKVAELRERLYNILKNKGIEVTAAESLNSLIEKVREVEPALEPQTIYLTQNNTSYDVTEYTEAIVDVPPVTVENDLDGLIDGSLTSFTMPSNISTLASARFSNFANLLTVIIPEVKDIPSNTFEKCINLSELNIPYAKIIGSSAFGNCYNLSNINIDSALYIESNAFSNCFNLTSLNANTVLEIGSQAFVNCINLSQISLNNLRMLSGYDIFKDVELESFVAPRLISLYNIGSFNINNSIDINNLMYIENVIFPSNLNNTILNLSYLSSISENLGVYASRAFIENFSNLTSLNVDNLNTVSIFQTAYFVSKCKNLSELNLPNLTKFSGAGLARNMEDLSIINAPNLWSIYVNGGLYFIDNCPNLTSLNMPLLQNIPARFMSNSKIESLNFPYASNINNSAFYNLSKLNTLYAPNTRTIGQGAFYNCSSLIDLTIKTPLLTIGNSAFYNNYMLSKTINMASTFIGLSAFYGCTNIKELRLNTVSYISDINSMAFTNCGILSSDGKILVPSVVLSNFQTKYSSTLFSNKFEAFSQEYENSNIFAYEYYGKTSVTSFPESRINAVNIYRYAFSNISFPNNMTLPEVEYIGEYAFSRCSGPTSLNLPKCKFIGDHAFHSYYNNMDLSAPELEYLGSSALYFSNANYTRTMLYIPKIKYIGSRVFGNGNYQSLYLSEGNLSQLEAIENYAFNSIRYFGVKDNLLSVPKLTYIPSFAFASVIGYYNSTGISRFSLYAPSVKTIDDYGFYYNSALAKVTLSDIEYIGAHAFCNCYYLTSVNSLYNCKIIGNSAFSNCYNLYMDLISPYLKSIGGSAFYNTKLSKLSAPELLYWGNGAFASCTNLKEIYAPLINKINFSQFDGCNKLSNLEIDFSAVSEIGQYAFRSCSSISTLSFINAKSVYTGAFNGCNNLSTLYLNSEYSLIYEGTFQNCYKLNFDNINLERITYIGSYAFRGCSNLSGISNSYIYTLYYDTFNNCANISYINTPNVFSLEYGVFRSCYNLESLNINYSKIKWLGTYTFADCSKLNSLYFPKLSGFDSYCFAGCGFSNFDVANVEIIPSFAFNSCPNLEYINLNNVTEIGSDAFRYCSKLSSINMSMIQSINQYAFANCTNLNINVPDLENITLGTYTYTGIKELENSYIKSVGVNAFASCSQLSVVSLINATYIAEGAFQNCSNLSEIYIPNISYLGPSALRSTLISSIPEYIDNNLNVINDWTFNNCLLLSEVKFNNIKNIYGNAFQGCNALTNIELGNISSIANLGTSAFYSCYNVENISLPNIQNLRSRYYSSYSCNAMIVENSSYKVFECYNMKKLYAPNCSEFASYVFYNGLASIEEVDLRNCTSVYAAPFSNKYYLKNINLNKLPTISNYFFYYCTNLESVNVENILGSISTYAFGYCGKLSSLYLPSVTNIFENAFVGCANLKTITTDTLKYIGPYAFQNCYSLSNINTEFVDYVEYSAFYNCNNLEKLSAAYLGSWALMYCSKLSSVYILNARSDAIYNFQSVFANTPMTNSAYLGYYGSIYVPSKALSLYRQKFPAYAERFVELSSSYENKYIFRNEFYGSTINISDINTNISYILGYGFFRASFADSTSLTFNNVKYIGSYAFYTTSITNISAPNCEILGGYAFYSCDRLTELNLPKVYDAGEYLVSNCFNLSIISMPNLKYANYNTFTNSSMSNVKELYLDNALVAYGAQRFNGLQKLWIPNASAFSLSTVLSLTDINLAGLSAIRLSVEAGYETERMLLSKQLSSHINYLNIGAKSVNALYYIFSGRTINTLIMSNISLVTSSLFKNTNISYAEFEKATAIGSSTFNGASINDINMPEVISLHSAAFANASINNISWPKLTRIGSYAFNSAFINSPTMNLNNVTWIDQYAFQNLSGVSTIKLNNLSSAAAYAFGYAPFETLRFKQPFSLTTERTFNYAKTINIAFDSDITTLYGMYQFSNMSSLTRVVFNGNILSYSQYWNWISMFANTPISDSTILGYYGSIYVRNSYYSIYSTLFANYISRITTIEEHETELRNLGLID